MGGPFILGFPWWLSVAIMVVFAAALWYLLDGWVRPLVRVPLVIVLAPTCVLAVVVFATAIYAALGGPYEPPPRTEHTSPTTTPVPSTEPTTTKRTASPTASPSPSPTASPSASPGP
jgi:hypothetical protein